MNVLAVNGLCKNYPSFALDHVSFDLAKGKITGFIGRNGAGKTTTIKSLLNLVHPDSGEITFFGKPFAGSEFEIKQKIGFASGGVNFYPNAKIRTITNTTKRFYRNWDGGAYAEYMSVFGLNESKRPSELSEGMKVKYSLALALSHNAELLILDEPTSGLDPVSRDDLLDVFLMLCEKGITILFSTHITSDIDKCADKILYIKNGKILADDNLEAYLSGYKLLSLTAQQLAGELAPKLIGCKRSKNGYTALIKANDAQQINLPVTDADLESVMVHMEKE